VHMRLKHRARSTTSDKHMTNEEKVELGGQLFFNTIPQFCRTAARAATTKKERL
jgi:hypothetical protein